MTTEEYVKEAMRTECDQDKSRERMGSYRIDGKNKWVDPLRVNHAILGMCSEVGELAAQLMKWIYYGSQDGQAFDATKFKDELGDVFWFAAQLCDALGVSFEEVMEVNNRKLRVRFPDKYSDEKIANKDRGAEAKAMERKKRACPNCQQRGGWEDGDEGQFVTCKRCDGTGELIDFGV